MMIVDNSTKQFSRQLFLVIFCLLKMIKLNTFPGEHARQYTETF